MPDHACLFQRRPYGQERHHCVLLVGKKACKPEIPFQTCIHEKLILFCCKSDIKYNRSWCQHLDSFSDKPWQRCRTSANTPLPNGKSGSLPEMTIGVCAGEPDKDHTPAGSLFPPNHPVALSADQRRREGPQPHFSGREERHPLVNTGKSSVIFKLRQALS